MIIDDENTRLRELYGEYYISEMIRNPDSSRQLIIGEDADGSVAGVMCLNSTIDVDLLNENFELTPYNGLRKSHENDKTSASNESLQSSTFSQEYQRFDRNLNDDTSLIEIIRDKKNSEERGQFTNHLFDDLHLYATGKFQ